MSGAAGKEEGKGREGGREWENQKFLLHEGFRDRIEEGEPYLAGGRRDGKGGWI